MDYMFSYIKRNGKEVPIVRVMSTNAEEVNLPYGTHQSVTFESKFDIVSHDYTVLNKFKTDKDTADNYYAWYFIENHVETIDRSPAIKLTAEQNSANIDYISMMTGVDLPNEDEKPEGLLNE